AVTAGRDRTTDRAAAPVPPADLGLIRTRRTRCTVQCSPQGRGERERTEPRTTAERVRQHRLWQRSLDGCRTELGLESVVLGSVLEPVRPATERLPDLAGQCRIPDAPPQVPPPKVDPPKRRATPALIGLMSLGVALLAVCVFV